MVEAKKAKRPSMRQAMRAQCFICCGDMLDGRIDCEIVTCPIYYWQPYAKLEPDLSWQQTGSHLQKNRKALREGLKRGAPADLDIDTDMDEDEDEADDE